tara:strand:+ start:2021 stop:2341 length:321 start_codon:yes stop_codon:yes gene_type:complete
MKLTTPNLIHLPKVIEALKEFSSFSAKSHLYSLIEDIKFPELALGKHIPHIINKQTNYTPIANWLIKNDIITIQSTGNQRFLISVLPAVNSVDLENVDPTFIQKVY